MNGNPLKILVVDNSARFRQILSSVIEEIDFAQLIGIANDGKEAIQKIETLNPDVVTLDVEMPILNGIETLEIVAKRWPNIKVIMMTSSSEQAIKNTISAIESSAYTFITKQHIHGRDHIRNKLYFALRELSHSNSITTPDVTTIHELVSTEHGQIRPPKVIAIGTSTGGPKALSHIISQIPSDIPVPMIIVQHIPGNFSKPLAESLNSKASVMVKEAEHGEKLIKGIVYLAPGGKHLKISGRSTIVITDDAPEVFCKPSVDYLFRSLSKEFPGEVLPVILTGMGTDGTKGLQLLKRHGAFSIGQDKATSTVYGMPASAMEAGMIDIEVPLNRIIPTILEHL